VDIKMSYQTISLQLTQHSYPVFIGQTIIDRPELLKDYIKGQQVLIVTQEEVASLYLLNLQKVLSDFQCDVHYVPQGEAYKNLEEWQKIFATLLHNRHERSTTLIALGGGIVGDMTGFAAACYQRGVNYIQIPTTLMAQVDSAIGGKTGVNHPFGKNMIGAFHHPQCVIADVNTLNTLSRREFISGLAEVVKYGLIADREFFSWLENNVEKILKHDADVLEKMVAHCVSIKTNIVMQDELDHGVRNLLNFGHTFGHALETALAYRGMLHGEAVALGMLMASELSHQLQLISENDLSRIFQLLKRLDLLQQQLDFPDVSELISLMRRDKKIQHQSLQFIVLQNIGQAIKTTNVTEKKLKSVIEKVLQEKCRVD
jgi:3-dehydroquinate synthase